MDLIDQLIESDINMTGVRICRFGHDENGISGVIYTTYTEDGKRIDEFVPWEDMVQPDTYSTPESISSMTYFQFVVLYGCARDKVGKDATPETVMNYFAQNWDTLVKERDDLWNSIPHGLLPLPVRKSEYTPPTISSMTYEESYALYQDFQAYVSDEAKTADTTIDPGSLDGPNPIGGGHHRYHFVQYGETQEYLESLAKEGYMMVYLEDNPPEEGKLTISKPNPEPDPITITAVSEPINIQDLVLSNENEAKTADTTIDPGSLDGPNPIGGGHHRYHFVQYGETQEYLESLAKEGYMMVYLEDNPPEEGKLTISKPNPEPDPITITAVSEPINIQELVLSIDLTEEEIADVLHSYSEIVQLDPSDIPSYLKIILKFTMDTNDTDPAPPHIVYLNFVDKEAWSAGKIATIAKKIASSYSQFNVSIVTEKPAEGEFYTVCIGTTEALKEYTASQGLVFDSEKPNVKSGTAFAEVNRDLSQNLGDLFYDPNIIVSIGNQLSALLADECPGISNYSPVQVFSDIAARDQIQGLASESSPVQVFSDIAARDYGEGWSVIGRGDFNGNGTNDVLVANPTAASDTVGLIGCWENDSEWQLIGGYSPEWDVLATADFNGDGKTDILWRNSFVGEDGNTYNAYCTWIMNEADSWRMVSASNADEWNFLCTGDFDGDGTADIAMINASGLVSIWGVSDGRLSADAVLSAVDTSEWQFAGVGDFNGDGTTDIAWLNSETMDLGCWQVKDGQISSWSRESITPYLVAGEQLYMIQNASLA